MQYLASVTVSTPQWNTWLILLLGVIIGMIIAIKLR